MPVIDTHAALLIIYQLRGMLHLPDHHAVGLALPEEYYDTEVSESSFFGAVATPKFAPVQICIMLSTANQTSRDEKQE
jgi:hypothetical protein